VYPVRAYIYIYIYIYICDATLNPGEVVECGRRPNAGRVSDRQRGRSQGSLLYTGGGVVVCLQPGDSAHHVSSISVKIIAFKISRRRGNGYNRSTVEVCTAGRETREREAEKHRERERPRIYQDI